MNNVIDIYVNKDNHTWFEQLKEISSKNNQKFSTLVASSVEAFVRNSKNKPKILIEKTKWNDILNNMSNEEMIQLNTLILDLNKNIVDRLCKKL